MTDVSLESKRYLQHLINKAESYQNIRLRTLDYLEEIGVEKNSTVVNCVIMAILWLAYVRDEIITEGELLMIMGMDDSLASDKRMILDPEIAEMGFDDALDFCIMNGE